MLFEYISYGAYLTKLAFLNFTLKFFLCVFSFLRHLSLQLHYTSRNKNNTRHRACFKMSTCALTSIINGLWITVIQYHKLINNLRLAIG